MNAFQKTVQYAVSSGLIQLPSAPIKRPAGLVKLPKGRGRGWIGLATEEYQRRYRHLPEWRAYHTAYMRRWRAARKAVQPI